MDGFRSAEALRTLLQLYEGVRIGRVRCHPSAHSSVLLQVTDPTTLVRLARCAENANVAFYVWSDSQGVAEEAPESSGPWYELRAQADPVEMFCSCLVHDLTSRGTLEPLQGERLLAGWGWRA